MNFPYEDIVNLPHPVSSRHPRMSDADRAAQFSPFAALTGHDAAIRETARLTDGKAELDENEKARLNEALLVIVQNLPCPVTLTCFRQDERKAGGAYVTVTGTVKKLDLHEGRLVLETGENVKLGDVFEISLPS